MKWYLEGVRENGGCMNKRIAYCVIGILAIMLSGCSKKSENNDVNVQYTEDIIYEGEYVDNIDFEEEYIEYEYSYDMFLSDCTCTEDEGEDSLFDTTQPINVLFAGNSLLGNPRTVTSFEQIAEYYGYQVNIYDSVYDGMNLYFQIGLIKSNEFDTREKYEQADVVILQEYGCQYDLTYDSICEIIEYCKDDAVIYYYTTEYDYYGDYLQKIDENERIHIIDCTDLMCKIGMTECIPSSEYEYDIIDYYRGADVFEAYFHEQDGHPNMFTGFFNAAYTFTQLFKQDFVNYDYNAIDEKVLKWMPGDTAEEKESNYNVIVDIINEGVRE